MRQRGPAGRSGPSGRTAGRIGAGRCGTSIGSKSGWRFTRASVCRAPALVEYWQKPEELAHYARATVDILYKFPFSKRDAAGELAGEELEGIAARSDFDLSQHQRFSGKAMGVFDEELKVAWAKLDEAKKAALSKQLF